MTALEWLGGCAAGMGILVSVSAAFWFVVRSALRPLEVLMDSVRAASEKHDEKDDKRFEELRREFREDSGAHRRSP